MLKVLIVDDEYIMRQGLKYMINWEQEGYEIVGEATNGKDALELIAALRPHIIISDIVMPMLDGVDFSEAVHRMYPQIQTIILSGYDNFEYVKHTLMNGAVDYILKPTLNPDELRRILQKAAERIPGYILKKETGEVSYERMMERYLLGHDKELNTQDFIRGFHSSYYRIYAVNIKKENENGQDMSDVLYKKLERELYGVENIRKLMITIREELVCIIFGYEMSQGRELIAMLKQWNEQLVLLCSTCFGVVSRPFTQLEAVNEIYERDIVRNVDKAFYYQDEKLLVLEKEADRENGVPAGKFDFFRYNQLLGGKQYTEAADLLMRYHENALKEQMDVYRLKNQMKNMIYHFLDFLQLSEAERENYRYAFFGELDRTAYEKEYQSSVSFIMNKLTELSGQSRLQTDERIDRMLAYIAANYMEDLKLENLAEEFSFNYHYLSAYFNQQMQEGFSEYLNRIRIEKACGLLKENRLSIAQISSEVGYSEHSYFCRVFKKITGKTPSVFRRDSLR